MPANVFFEMEEVGPDELEVELGAVRGVARPGTSEAIGEDCGGGEVEDDSGTLGEVVAEVMLLVANSCCVVESSDEGEDVPADGTPVEAVESQVPIDAAVFAFSIGMTMVRL